MQSAVAEALARLTAPGTDPALLSGLGSARYDVGVLPAGALGPTDVAARRVSISADAAGYGWFADTATDPGPRPSCRAAWVRRWWRWRVRPRNAGWTC